MPTLRRLSIQSKLILLLLAVGLTAIAAVTWSSYVTARAAAMDAANRQLTGVRITKTNLLKVMLGNYRDQITSFATSRTARESLAVFAKGMAELGPPSPAELSSLETFYRTKYLPQLKAATGAQPQLSRVMPQSAPAQRLQSFYVAGSPGDGGAYSAAHPRLHDVYGQIARRLGLQDILLVDGARLEIVYSYSKGVELGTSLATGPYSNSNLGAAVRAMMKAPDNTAFQMADFELHRPALGRPAAFMCAPVFDGPVPAGVVVYQLPIDELVRVMTADYSWENEGLGKTGEVYLVGQDTLMRTQSRFLRQDAKEFLKSVRETGLPEKITNQIERTGTVILALPVNTESAKAALSGRDGVMEIRDYRDVPVLSAYGPLDFENIRWAVLAEMDSSEAYGPVADMGRKALAAAAGLSILISLVAVAAASLLTRPIRALTAAARRVTSGEVDVQVHVETEDELRELGDAFNQMTRALKSKTDQLESTLRDNEELLLNILPAPAAARLRDGDERPSQTFNDVSILIATLGGLEHAPQGEQQAMDWLHYLVVAFDDAAERHGVEKLKTMGSSYLAACGLSFPRPDHPQRTVEFAEELIRIVRMFNHERGAQLEVDVGINAGPVTGGVVGRKKFIYDLWGETVNLAKFVLSDGQSSIQVTQSVYERLREQYSFQRQPDVPTKSGTPLAVYRFHSQNRAGVAG